MLFNPQYIITKLCETKVVLMDAFQKYTFLLRCVFICIIQLGRHGRRSTMRKRSGHQGRRRTVKKVRVELDSLHKKYLAALANQTGNKSKVATTQCGLVFSTLLNFRAKKLQRCYWDFMTSWLYILADIDRYGGGWCVICCLLLWELTFSNFAGQPAGRGGEDTI